MIRNKLVIWSGGCDSTLALYNIANEFPQQTTHAVSFVFEQNDKADFEAESRAKFKNKFLFNIEYSEIRLKVTGAFDSDATGPTQVSMWFGLMQPFMKHHTDVYMGYVAGDSFWSVREYADQVFHNLAKINGLQDCTLNYPFRNSSKVDIIESLQANGLYNHVWWCENPAKKPHEKPLFSKPWFDQDVRGKFMCGHCPSCESHIKGLLFLDYKKERQFSNKLVRNKHGS